MDWARLHLAETPPFQVAPPLPENSPTFIVDDDPDILDFVGNHLRRCGYPVREFLNPVEAGAALAADPPALLISDVVMPDVSGIELACHALEENPQLGVIILTGAGSEDVAVASLRLGVADYLQKPVEVEELDDCVQRVLYRRSQALYRQQLEAWLRGEVVKRTGRNGRQDPGPRITVPAMAALVEVIAAYAQDGEKGERIAALAVAVARHLELTEDQVEAIGVAALLHDIGMAEVGLAGPAADLGRSQREDERFRRHPTLGAEILKCLSRLEESAGYVLHHHERLDGSGYPDGLRGDEIPLGAQIVGLAETFVSMIEGRPSWPALAPGEALEALRGVEGIWYGAGLLDALEAIVEDVAA